jgi:hypothetical protein
MRGREFRQSGVTYVEIIMVIVIGVAAVLGAIATLKRFRDGPRRVDAAYAGLSALRGQAGEFVFGPGIQDRQELAPILLGAGLVPPVLRKGDVMLDPWGGAVSVVRHGTVWTVTFPLVPQKGCVALAMLAGPEAQALEINGKALAVPPNAGLVTTACAGGAAMSWDYAR